MGRITDTVKTLLIINVIFYVGSLSLGNVAYDLFALWFPENENFQIWQLVTHMFMHSDKVITHILFNMFMLYMFGSHLEQAIGQKKFIFLYFSSGVGAFCLNLFFNYLNYYPNYQIFIEQGFTPDEISQIFKRVSETGRYVTINNVPNEITKNLIDAYFSRMVGASGAINGIIAAFAVLFPNLPLYIMFIPVPIKAKYLIGGYFLLDLYGGITGQAILGPSNIAHWAHIGGAVIGFITMWYWKKNSFNNNRWY